MKSKSIVWNLLDKMPDDVTLAEVIRWVNIIDLIGTEESAELSLDLDRDLASFFSKKKRAARESTGTNAGNAKERVLHVLSILPDDVAIGEVLNRLVLVHRIEIGIRESDRAEGMDHDEFFKQLANDDEENTAVVATGRAKGPARNTKTNRGNRPQDRRKVRPAS